MAMHYFDVDNIPVGLTAEDITKVKAIYQMWDVVGGLFKPNFGAYNNELLSVDIYRRGTDEVIHVYSVGMDSYNAAVLDTANAIAACL